MTGRARLLVLPLLVMLSCSAVPVASQRNEEILEFWSSWACTSDREASRSRAVANCTIMESIDPMTNMTNVTTTCNNRTEMENRTDVISVSLGFSEWSPAPPPCGAMRSFTQSRSTQCLMVDIQCSDVCNRRTSVRTIDIPLCCTALPWNQWTSWTSLTCSAVAAQQTRQRMRNRTSCDDCDDDCGACEDDCAVERENRTVSPTTWSEWGSWSDPEEQPCANGQRTRQRTCPNDTLLFCEFECPLGDVQLQTDCCVVPYQWTQWTTWTETQSDCPSVISTRERTCIRDDAAVTRNVTMIKSCSSTCTLDVVEPMEQDSLPDRCIGVGGSSRGRDNGFPVWAIAVISAVGVIVVVGGFVLATIIGRKLARSQEYSIGEATMAAQKQYEQMYETTDAASPSGYRPTDSFDFQPSGITPDLDSYEEKQF